MSGSPEFSRKGFFPSTLHGAPSGYDTKLIAVRAYLRRAFGGLESIFFSLFWELCFILVVVMFVGVVLLGFYVVFSRGWAGANVTHGIRATVREKDRESRGSVVAPFGFEPEVVVGLDSAFVFRVESRARPLSCPPPCWCAPA